MWKSKPILIVSIMIMALMALFSLNAFADSSWVWISEKRPFDILPWVALGTILIEWLSIWLIPKTGHALKVLGIVMIANAASFLLPYAFLKADLSWYGTFEHILDSGPHYIVSGVFLLLTISIEMPIVYNALKKQVQDRKKLKVVIIISNIITTAGVAIVERLITEGHW
jgi:hypothetical protein